MIAATRRWVRRNRGGIAIGAGVIGAGYLAGQYVVGKIQEARQRMGEDRIAKEKCVLAQAQYLWSRLTSMSTACGAALNKIKMIAHIPSLPSYLLSETRLSMHYL